MANDPDHFKLLRKINSLVKKTQIELASELGFNLGKLNHCIKVIKTKV